MSKQIDIGIILQISSELPQGCGKRIQELSGYSQQVVSSVRNGKKIVPQVIEAILQVHKEEQAKIKELNNKIQSAIS